MAIIRRKELHTIPESELKEKLKELQQELMSQRAKMASGGLPDNPGKIREIKRTIARLKTIAGMRGYKIDE